MADSYEAKTSLAQVSNWFRCWTGFYPDGSPCCTSVLQASASASFIFMPVGHIILHTLKSVKLSLYIYLWVCIYIYMYIYTVVGKTSYIYTSLSNLPIPNLGCYPPEQRVKWWHKKCPNNHHKCHLPTHLICSSLTLGGSVAVKRILRSSRHDQSSAVASVQAEASVADHILGCHHVLRPLQLGQHAVRILLDPCHPVISAF